MSKPSHFNPSDHTKALSEILSTLDKSQRLKPRALFRLLKLHTKPNGDLFSKTELIAAFTYFQPTLKLKTSLRDFQQYLQKKPVRSGSGVTPVTVLTKPFPCPGKCIFCPSDVRMPKSYLAGEPGAQRAAANAFDPYLQTYSRLETYHNNGHPVGKVEIIVLGGTWSYYPPVYQVWYIKRCFDALNDFSLGKDNRSQATPGSDFTDVTKTLDGSHLTQTYNQAISKELIKRDGRPIRNSETADWPELLSAQKQNETAASRCVGLVIETRPDNISPEEVLRLRRLGCTKAQIGFQSLSDQVLTLNKRGHTVAATRSAMRLLRSAGFKIHAHWMPNLYGSNPEADKQDFLKIFSDPDFCPDELKIYPCSLISSAELMAYYQKGLWQPYTHAQLLDVLTFCLEHTPRYCRLTRVIRDIPGPDIVVGNKATNFRQIAEAELARLGRGSEDIRAREIKNRRFDPRTLKLKDTLYQTSTSIEHFLEWVTLDDHILGFLRLSLPFGQPKPSQGSSQATNKSHSGANQTEALESLDHFLPELQNSAIIREVHVYGPAVRVGDRGGDRPQHLGLGKKLIRRAQKIATDTGFKNLAVISAIGTRQYYLRLGFTHGHLYQHLQHKHPSL